VYDTLNRLTQEIDPLSHSLTYAYDAANQLTSVTDRLGRRQDYAYDRDGRVLTDTWYNSSGSVVNLQTYSYDPTGNMLTAGDASGTYTLAYDALDRVATVKELFGVSLTFGYDAVSNRTLVQDSFGGVATSVYNAVNLLSSRQFSDGTTPVRFDLSYTARNQVASLTRYADLAGTTKVGESDYSYDTVGRLTNLQHKNGSGTVQSNTTYTYDLGSRLTVQQLNGVLTSYQYDASNQVTSDGLKSYSYDATGNRTMTGYTTGSGNQLTSDGTWTYSYDAEGNLSKKSKGAAAETWTYGYDNNNHLLWAQDRATDGGTLLASATYAYDVFGNRVEQDTWTQATGTVAVSRYAYDGWKRPVDGAGQPYPVIGNENFDAWADLDGSNHLVTRRVFGDQIDQPVARITASSGAVAWYQADRQGSIVGLTDNSGAAQDAIGYDGYGNKASESNASFGDAYGYDGLRRDAVTGLYDGRGRYYDPVSGRWTSQDPLGLSAGDANVYRSFGNSPTNATDPSGLKDAQTIAMEGVKRNPVNDLSGPDVTKWFVKDIVDQIEYRAARISSNIDKTPGTPPRVRALPDLEDFKKQAAYYLSPKWHDFGSPKEGRGVNTVVVEGRVLRKNQLGNIELGVISDLMAPLLPWIAGNSPIEFAYLGTRIYRKLLLNPDAVSTYWTDHRWKANYGDFVGLVRADNLAAFGVGHGIYSDIKTSAAATLKQIQEDVKAGRFNKLTDGQRKKLEDAVAASVKRIFTDADTLGRRVNKYNAVLSKKLGRGKLKIKSNALFFIPEYGGFNTDSLKPNKTPYTGKNSIDYFKEVLEPLYKQYQKDLGDSAYDIDQWVRKYHEDYKKYKQMTWK